MTMTGAASRGAGDTMGYYEDFTRTLGKFARTFAGAAAQRNARPDFDPVTQELGWVAFEREQMHQLVNTEREARGLPPVSAADIERVETSASGHIDYAQKFALGCTELALGNRD